MIKVGTVIEEMFPQNAPGIDSALQSSVITNMYKRNTAIPMYAGNDNIIWGPGEEEQAEEEEQVRALRYSRVLRDSAFIIRP